MRGLGVFLCALPLLGQNVRVSSGSAAPGEKIAIEIALDSPSGKEPLAMQWDADLPGEALKLEGTGPVAGKAAQAAGKNLTCAPKKTIPGPFKWVCILAGGQMFRAKNALDKWAAKLMRLVSDLKAVGRSAARFPVG